MKITKDAWLALAHNVQLQSNGILNKSVQLDYNHEVSAKNGGAETVISMITELESTLRVMKRRLILSLPKEDQEKYQTFSDPI